MAGHFGILNSNLVFLSILLLLSFCEILGYESACTRCERDHRCKPPKCVCCGRDMPLPTNEVPQMVFFTFDDAVNTHIAGFYRQLFDSNRKNPNGCPISMTLFISHANTVYTLVREFYQKGMEIASHSVSHAHPSNKNFRNEAKKQKENLARMARIPTSKIKGWRSPFLEPVGDAQPNTLQKLGYAYDATLTVARGTRGTKAPKPFTLDYGWPYDCKINPCPRRSHKGFWEVPVISITDYLGKYECVYVDGCNNPPPDEESAFNFLWENFLTYYKGNKAPFGINMHAAWFYHPDRLKAMDRFIQELVKLDDVYIVSVRQVIAWLQNPTPLQNVASLESWGCSQMNKNSSAFHLRNTKIQRRIHEIKQSNLKKKNDDYVRKHYEWKQKQNAKKQSQFSSHRKSNPGHYLHSSNIWQGLAQPGSSWSSFGRSRSTSRMSEFAWSSPAMSWQSLLAKYAQIQSKKAQERNPRLSQAQIAREKERKLREQKRIKEQQRIAKQKRIQKEAAELAKQRQKEEQAKLAERQRIEEEKKRIEEMRIAAEKQKAAERRLAEEKRLAEERRIAEEKRKAEERRLVEEKRRAEERRLAEERRKAEQQRLTEERRKAQKRRLAEEKRKAEERRLAEERRKAEEQRLKKERQKAEELRLAEERQKAEKRRIFEEKRKMEERRQAEVKRLEEERRIAKERQIIAEKERRRKEEERQLKAHQRLIQEQKRLEVEKKKADEAARVADLKRISAEKQAAEYKRLLETNKIKEMASLKENQGAKSQHQASMKETTKLPHLEKIRGYKKKEQMTVKLRQNAHSKHQGNKYEIKKASSHKKHIRNLSVHLATSAEKQEVRLIGEPWRTWYSDSGLVEMKEPWKTWILQKNIVKTVTPKPQTSTKATTVLDSTTMRSTTEMPTSVASITSTEQPTTYTKLTSTVPNTKSTRYVNGLSAQITVKESKNQVVLTSGLILPKSMSSKVSATIQNNPDVTSPTIPSTTVLTTTISPDTCVQERNCFRPACVCKAEQPPLSLSSTKIPQIVYITIEGDINFLSYSKMRSIFTRYRRNPNGCRISGTFFASDVGSNYRLASILKRDGIEIGINGMKATPYVNGQEISKDMSDHLQIITDYTGIVRSDIKGWRTPLMKPVGDGQFDALKRNSLYDASLVTARSFTNDSKIWPFTLDFGWSDVCVKGDCPTKKHPGVWEVPVIPLVNTDNVTTCDYADGCTSRLTTAEETENFLLNNFNNYYQKNRAPFGIHISQKWFYWINNRNLYGFSRFIDSVLKKDDVYVVSISQMLDWVKKPVSLNSIRSFNEWRC